MIFFEIKKSKTSSRGLMRTPCMTLYELDCFVQVSLASDWFPSMRMDFFCLLVAVFLTAKAALLRKSSVLQPPQLPRFSSRRLGFGQKAMTNSALGDECKMSHSKLAINSEAGKRMAASLSKLMKAWVSFAKKKSISYSLASGVCSFVKPRLSLCLYVRA